MRKYLTGVLVALVIIAVWEGTRYVRALRTEAATAHLQAQQGAQAFAFLATVLKRDDTGAPTLTLGDALAQMVQAHQLKESPR